MKYFIKTFGCQMNFSDSERIQTFLHQNKLAQAKTIKTADLVILNTCGVRQTAEDRAFGQVHNLRKNNPQVLIVITGCLAHRKDVKKKMKDKVDVFLPINKIQDLFKDLFTKDQSSTDKEGTKQAHYLKLKPQYKKKSSVFVPVMTGCNNFCSYCVVPYARGQEWSRPIDDIIEEIGKTSQEGCSEVLLLGQNVNSYKFKNYSFPLLLDLLAELYPTVMFTFLTSHPKDFSDELIEVIASRKNISRKIHLPIQSGSNKILKAMNRHYTQKHYLGIIDKIKTRIPDAEISTDVIVGFPGETLKAFQETKNVFKEVGFCKAYINKYSPRPGTAAERLGNPIPCNEKKRRENILRKLL
ncbi:MAG: tRNA (N6-isopentenyl adenosine(37)-C2)-methylthiotransferase MiaB [Patescibacteria group bacterium]|nr:tRNA (N6-isopentenyl adenosine(37)-C2)-methylthiotransferase MiaB [Patescibacteria group bacterium]